MDNPFVGFFASHSLLAIPFGLAAGFYFLFQTFDTHLAKSVKERFSAYLLSARYEAELPNLPEITASVFRSLFGSRQLSWKCVKRSAGFSVLALISLLTFTFLYDPSGAISVLRTNTRNSSATGITVALFAIWTFWCLIPDYLSLAKTRHVIKFLSTKEIGLLSGILIILADFITGSLMFLLVFSLAQGIAALAYTWWLGKLPPLFKHVISDIGMASAAVAMLVVTLLLVELVAFIPYGNLYTIVPYADLFWASMWPSAWMWSYIALSILTRNAIRLFPFARRVRSVLDFDDHPFRELGLVGAILVAAVGYVVLGAIMLNKMLW